MKLRDVMLWYNKKYVSSGSQHRASKTLVTSWVVGLEECLLLSIVSPFHHTWAYGNEVTLGGWGPVVRGTNHVTGGLKLPAPHQGPGREKGLGIEVITNGHWFNQSCPHNRYSIKTPKTKRFREHPYWKMHRRSGRGSAPQTPQRQKLLCSGSLPYIPLHLAVHLDPL